MATGTVKWFNPTKGFGFIEPTDGGKDVFVHITAVERSDEISYLNEGDKIEYDVQSEKGKESAQNLRKAA
ncbi:MAG: cold-shock protein [Rhodospirillales bacterium]|nr:cold-shock protein [Rhodospirillales bacterium]